MSVKNWFGLFEKAISLNLYHFKRIRMSSSTGTESKPEVATNSPSSVQGSSKEELIRCKCIFCKIIDGKEESNILFQNDEIVVFPDIRPVAKHHYLIVPKEHIKSCKSLDSSHIGLVDRLVEVGNKVLEEQLAKENPPETGGDASPPPKLLGYHWPPFHTVSHLHLHIIAPSDKMTRFGRWAFRPNSMWFVSPEYVRDRLQKAQ